MTSGDRKPLPPGSSGLPLLGETLPFLRDIFGFVHRRIGDGIFRTHLLGQPTVVMAGPDACSLWLDESIIQREGAFPKPVRELFGGVSLPLLDGPAHRLRKRLIMEAFTPEALVAYLPVLDRSLENAIERWSREGELRWLDELKRLAIEGICGAVFGLTPGSEMDALLTDYQALLKGFTGLPVNLPGTDFAAALRARDRILERLDALAQARKETPGDDGVSRLLAARGPGGEAIDRAALCLELHHLVLAGLIIFAEFVEILLALEQEPALHERLRAEILRVVPAGPLTREHLAALPSLVHFLLEVKRHCKNVPVSFGKARRSFEFKGYLVPEGWLVFLAVGENNHWSGVYREPERFDPERFAPGREEHLAHPHAYVPQGPGTYEGHKCAGFDFSTLFMEVFTVRLLRDTTWKLSQQDLSFRTDVVPPEPREGLRAVINRR
jgi:cytochrome P450